MSEPDPGLDRLSDPSLAELVDRAHASALGLEPFMLDSEEARDAYAEAVRMVDRLGRELQRRAGAEADELLGPLDA